MGGTQQPVWGLRSAGRLELSSRPSQIPRILGGLRMKCQRYSGRPSLPHRLLESPMTLSATPRRDGALVRLGPGGDFVTDLLPDRNGRLTRSSPPPADPLDGYSEDGWASASGFSLLRRRSPLDRSNAVAAT